MELNGLSILMFILGTIVFLCGLYLYTGHKSELLLWKTHNVKNMTKEELKLVGKWTMISACGILLFGFISMFFDI